MRSAGVPTSLARKLGASFAATLCVLVASAIAFAQSSPDTAATETWKAAAASASAAAGKPAAVSSSAIAEAALPAPPRIVAAAATPSSSSAVAPANLVPTPPDMDATQRGAAEIPSANAAPPPAAPAPQLPTATKDDLQSAANQDEIARYEAEQSGMPPEQLKALQEFDAEGELTTPFGMELREAKRTLKSGEEADGLLITTVAKDGPAAAAGLHGFKHDVHDAIAAAAMVGAVFSGGLSVVVIPAIDYMQVGESYDMIIGVDGSRVTNFIDFQDQLRDLQPGEVVYLSVVRDGKRMQVQLPVPANYTANY